MNCSKETWQSISKKYKTEPYFRIEDFGKYQELHFYHNIVKIYKFPLKITDIVYLSRFFPDDVEFFEQALLITFKGIRRYGRQ